MEKISEAKSWILKINKNYKPLVTMIRLGMTHITNIRNEKGDITTDSKY